MKKILILLIMIITLASCTENERVRAFGGNQTIEIPKGRKLLTMTWKQTDLWILTEDSSNYYFSESSSWGIWQGEIKVPKNK